MVKVFLFFYAFSLFNKNSLFFARFTCGKKGNNSNIFVENHKNMINSTIKGNIYLKRKELNLTQEELAQKLGISVTAYRDLERGNTNMINSHIPKIAEILETNIEELILGYKPLSKDEANLDELEIKYMTKAKEKEDEYNKRIENLLNQIQHMQTSIDSLKETVKTKNDIIGLLKKTLDQEKENE